MKLLGFVISLSAVLALCVDAQAQPGSRGAASKPAATEDTSPVRSSPAYAEVLLRQTEIAAELESLLLDYTDDHPRVKDLRLELELLKPEIERLVAVKPQDAGRLTLAVGKLVLGKVRHLADLRRLQSQYKDEHPSVKKAKKLVDVFEAAIRDILG